MNVRIYAYSQLYLFIVHNITYMYVYNVHIGSLHHGYLVCISYKWHTLYTYVQYVHAYICMHVQCNSLCCRRAREDLKASNRRINTMLADYGDVVPRRDYERLEGSFQTLENEHEQLKNDHITLLEEQRFVCAYKDFKCCGVM